MNDPYSLARMLVRSLRETGFELLLSPGEEGFFLRTNGKELPNSMRYALQLERMSVLYVLNEERVNALSFERVSPTVPGTYVNPACAVIAQTYALPLMRKAEAVRATKREQKASARQRAKSKKVRNQR